jgi:glutamine synthetase
MSRVTGKSSMDTAILDRYMNLPQHGKVQAEYVWIDAAGKTRSKTRTLEKSRLDKAGDGPLWKALPNWTFDGSSTGQAPGEDSEVIIRPVATYPDPFRPGNGNILVLCDTYTPEGQPLPTNTRAAAAAVFASPEAIAVVPWFGLEQEYTLFNLDGVTPLGWPEGGYPMPQGPYYCGAGADRVFGRAVPEAHYKACLYAGLPISGINAEVMPGQWEYQIGPAVGIAGGDDTWMARYILDRVCEDFGVLASIHPKPITKGDWNGAGMHINFSTKEMREAPVNGKGGMHAIIDAVNKLGARHAEHIAVYGDDNELRLTGKHETASINEFSYGVANRGCSIRIPRETDAQGYGYFEDRRPASNVDTYVATGKIMKTIMEKVTPPAALRKDKKAATL